MSKMASKLDYLLIFTCPSKLLFKIIKHRNVLIIKMLKLLDSIQYIKMPSDLYSACTQFFKTIYIYIYISHGFDIKQHKCFQHC